MFNIKPFQALHFVVRVTGDKTTTSWQPCRAVGVDATSSDITNIVECRNAMGDLYLDREQYLRPSAA